MYEMATSRQHGFVKGYGLVRDDRHEGALSEKSSKTFCCPASPSARRTASWKSLNEYRTIAGALSAPFDNMVRRSLVAARTSASGWELTQRGSHHPRTVAVE
jgi:hypothetical protein